MRRAAALAVLSLLGSPALAGCLAGDEEATVASAGAWNVIRGQVVDPASTPLAGATVALATRNVTVVADEEGRFRFNRVPDGEFLLVAALDGYRSVVNRVTVSAGADREITLALEPLPTAEPYKETVEKRGFVSCGAAVRTGDHGDSANYALTCGEQDPNDQRELLFEVTVGEGVAGIVLELAWEARNPGSRVFDFHAEQILGDAEAPRPLGGTEGTGYASILIPQSVAREYFLGGGTIRTRTEPTGSFLDEESPSDAALVAQQDFTVYATVFYHAPPPPGWSILDAG